jgi:restriction system protein
MPQLRQDFSQGDGPEQELLALLHCHLPHVRVLAASAWGKFARQLPPATVAQLEHLRTAEDDADTHAALGRAIAAMQAATAGPHGGKGGEVLGVHGGYDKLKAYEMAEYAFDGTCTFCKRFIDYRSRTNDQMVQAARSGKQNIVEGSAAAGISKKMELKLVGVARASLEELKKDYEDYLRVNRLAKWDKNDPPAKAVRKLAYRENKSYTTYRSYFERDSAEVAANTALCLIHQACYLLDKLLQQLEGAFLDEGGFSEKLYKARQARRRGERNP